MAKKTHVRPKDGPFTHFKVDGTEQSRVTCVPVVLHKMKSGEWKTILPTPHCPLPHYLPMRRLAATLAPIRPRPRIISVAGSGVALWLFS